MKTKQTYKPEDIPCGDVWGRESMPGRRLQALILKGDEEMTRIREDEVRGYQFDTETVCKECATPEELEDLNRDEILTAEDIGSDLVFCDRCKKQIED